MTTNRPLCQIIGAGRAGRAIACAMALAGYRFTWIGSLHGESARALAEKVGCPSSGTVLEGFSGTPGFTIIAVPDNSIECVAGEIASLGIICSDSVVAHLSGALASGTLSVLRAAGASVMAFHPAQTFTLSSDPSTVFQGICFDMEGDDHACRVGETVARDIGARSLRLDPGQRLATHLAMTIASNFTVGLMGAAEDIMVSEAGLSEDEARALLLPLFRQTAENIVTSGPADALTGPVARGDSTVVRHHLALLEHMNPRLLALYRATARINLRLALESGILSGDAASEIDSLLRGDDNRI